MKIDKYRLIILIFSIVMVAALGFIAIKIFEKNNNSGTYSMNCELNYEGKTYERDENVEAYLLVGLDKYSEEDDEDEDTNFYNDKCADFILLLAIDHENKQITAFQINRDTMTQVSVLGIAGDKIKTKTCQIALSHCYGNGNLVSLRNTADAVSDLTNVDVTKYISVTMDGVSKITDFVGGVPVLIEDDFADEQSEFVKGETITLTGENALTFVRARSSMQDDKTNIARMGRQRAYIKSLVDCLKAKNAADEDFATDLYLEIADDITYNSSETQIKNLIDKVIDYEFTGIITFDGESKEGEEFMEFWPDKTDITKNVVEYFYKDKN